MCILRLLYPLPQQRVSCWCSRGVRLAVGKSIGLRSACLSNLTQRSMMTADAFTPQIGWHFGEKSVSHLSVCLCVCVCVCVYARVRVGVGGIVNSSDVRFLFCFRRTFKCHHKETSITKQRMFRLMWPFLLFPYLVIGTE